MITITSFPSLKPCWFLHSQRDIEYVAPRKWAHEDDGSNGDEEEEDDEATDGEPVGTLTAEQRELLESQFEKTLGEYGDENLGDLAEVPCTLIPAQYQRNLRQIVHHLFIYCRRMRKRRLRDTSISTRATNFWKQRWTSF